jgi:hypothetical protein
MNKNHVDKRNEITTNVVDTETAKPFLNKIDLFRVYPIQITAAFVTLFILSAIVIGSIIGVIVLKNKSNQFKNYSPNSSGTLSISGTSSKTPELITTNRPSNKNSFIRVNSTEKGFAKIYVHSAKVPHRDSKGSEEKSDPFVTITLKYYTNNTLREEYYSFENKVMSNQNHPIFNINCKTPSVPLVNSSLIFDVYDKDDIEYDKQTTNDLIGTIKVSILNDVINKNKNDTPINFDIFGKNDLNPQYYLNVTIRWLFDTILVKRIN